MNKQEACLNVVVLNVTCENFLSNNFWRNTCRLDDKKVENLKLLFIDLLKKAEAAVLSQIAGRCRYGFCWHVIMEIFPLRLSIMYKLKWNMKQNRIRFAVTCVTSCGFSHVLYWGVRPSDMNLVNPYYSVTYSPLLQGRQFSLFS